jgi:hypothetical protein
MHDSPCQVEPNLALMRIHRNRRRGPKKAAGRTSLNQRAGEEKAREEEKEVKNRQQQQLEREILSPG